MEKQPNSRTCFLCGRQNPIGLKMSWYNDPDARQIRADLVIPDHFNGYPGIAHGGIVAAILDETAGRAILLNGDTGLLMVTMKLEVKYRRPTPTGQPITAIGWILQPGEKLARAASVIRLPNGTVTAEGEVLLAKAPADIEAGWAPERQYWKVYDD